MKPGTAEAPGPGYNSSTLVTAVITWVPQKTSRIQAGDTGFDPNERLPDCFYRNDRVIVINRYCSKREINTTGVGVTGASGKVAVHVPSTRFEPVKAELEGLIPAEELRPIPSGVIVIHPERGVVALKARGVQDKPVSTLRRAQSSEWGFSSTDGQRGLRRRRSSRPGGRACIPPFSRRRPRAGTRS